MALSGRSVRPMFILEDNDLGDLIDHERERRAQEPSTSG
jgi:hypothetical protein